MKTGYNKKALTKEKASELFDNLKKVDAFLLGIYCTGQDDVYELRSGIFEIYGYLLRNM